MNVIIKRTLPFLCIIFFIKGSNAQSGEAREKTPIIGFTPSGTGSINGWGIGWAGIIDNNNYYGNDSGPVTINGLYTDISPLPVFAVGMGVMMVVLNPDMYKSIFTRDTVSVKKDTVSVEKVSDDWVAPPDTVASIHRMNGLAVSLMEFGENVSFHGVQISGGHYAAELTGVSISLTASGYNEFNGVMISPLLNWADYGSGIQIGLFNRSYKMKGVQIGLWNKIGKRGLPFINMSF